MKGRRKLFIGAAVLVLLGFGSARFCRRMFINVMGRTIQCRTELKSIAMAQKTYFEKHGRYAEDPTALDLKLEPGNRYAYFVSSEETPAFQVDLKRFGEERALRRSQLPLLLGNPRPGVVGVCPTCSASFACASNADADLDLDVWSISSVERTKPDGAAVAAWELHHDFDDYDDFTSFPDRPNWASQ